jgi:hypothetical protein
VIDSGYDLDVQISETALNRMLDGVLAVLFSQGQTRFPIRLPVVHLPFGLTLDFGTLELDLTSGKLVHLRPRTGTDIGVDVAIEVDASLKDLTVFGRNLLPAPFALGGIVFALDDVDLGLDETAAGIPTGLVLGISATHLQSVQPTPQLLANLGAIPWPFGPPSPIPGAFTFVLNLVTQVLNVGFRIAASLVPHIPVAIKPLVDAFVRYGLAFAPRSPYLWAVGASNDSLAIATSFQRAVPPPGGTPPPRDVLRAPENTGVVARDGLLNQAIGILFQKGIIASTFQAGGFTWYINQLSVALLSAASAPSSFVNPVSGAALGAVELFFALKGKRGSCWCKVKVKVTVRARLWPYVEAPAPPAAGPQQAIAIKAFFDIQATVQISGFLVVLAELVIGPLLPLYLFLLSQLANVLLDDYLPYTAAKSLVGSKLTFTLSSAKLAAYTTLAFDFQAAGGAHGAIAFDLGRFTSFRLVDATRFATLSPALQDRVTILVDYTSDSILVDDQEILLAAKLRT